MGTGSFPGVKRPGAWCWPPTPISARGHEGVELYLYSPSGPQWLAIGRKFYLLTVTHIHKCPPLVTFLSQMNLLHILAAHCLFYPFITCWFLTLKSSQLPAESHTCMITSCQLSVIANLHIQKTNKLCLLSSVRGGPTVRQYLCLLQSRRLNSEEGRQGKPHSYWTVRGNGV